MFVHGVHVPVRPHTRAAYLTLMPGLVSQTFKASSSSSPFGRSAALLRRWKLLGGVLRHKHPHSVSDRLAEQGEASCHRDAGPPSPTVCPARTSWFRFWRDDVTGRHKYRPQRLWRQRSSMRQTDSCSVFFHITALNYPRKPESNHN